MQKILLIEGGKCKRDFPNLALMKLSAYHKQKGDIVALNRMVNPDKIYVSCPFNRPITNLFEKLYKDVPKEIGGYGINNLSLSKEVEFIKPDYSLYNLDFSMGFTSRGCINACPFCVVPKNEGKIRHHQDIEEFMEDGHKKVILLDNSFTHSPHFIYNSDYLIDHNIQVNINQGINVRVLTEEQANVLKELKLRSWSFKGKMLHFAWDNPKEEKLVRNGIQLLLDTGFNPNNLTCYVLVNYNSTFDEDLYRCNVLWKEYKILPFIMSYNGKHKLQRWANRRFIKYCDFEDFDYTKIKKESASDFWSNDTHNRNLTEDFTKSSQINPTD